MNNQAQVQNYQICKGPTNRSTPWAHTIFLALIVLVGCGKAQQTQRKLNEAEKIWVRADDYDPTNEPRTAYQLLLHDQVELTRLQAKKPNALNYHYCLAIINCRLFLLARSSGATNEAEEFLRQSSFHFNSNRQDLRLPPTNFSAEEIEAKIQRYDAQVHPEWANTMPRVQ